MTTTDERTAALYKAANRNLATLRSRNARERFDTERARMQRDHQKVLDRAYKAQLRADIRETKDELKAVGRIVRAYEKRYDAGTLGDEYGAYEEADARETKLAEYLVELQEFLRRI